LRKLAKDLELNPSTLLKYLRNMPGKSA